MLGPTYLDFTRYFYCTCLTRPPDFLSLFRNLAGATQRINIDNIESQVVPAEEADTFILPVGCWNWRELRSWSFGSGLS